MASRRAEPLAGTGNETLAPFIVVRQRPKGQGKSRVHLTGTYGENPRRERPEPIALIRANRYDEQSSANNHLPCRTFAACAGAEGPTRGPAVSEWKIMGLPPQ